MDDPKKSPRTVEKLEGWLWAASALPAHHVVLLLANEVIHNPDAGAKDLEEVLALDPAVAMKILRLSASAAYGGECAETLLLAIMRIGFDATGDVLKVFSKLQKQGTFSPKAQKVYQDLWTHSVLSGLAAREIFRRAGVTNPEMLDRARLAGLLHDMGRLLLLAGAPERHELVIHGNLNGHLGSPAREAKVFGFDHQELGRVAGDAWNLGEEMTLVLAAHHKGSLPSREFILPHLAHLADWVAVKIQDEWQPDLEDPDQNSLKALRLDPKELRLSITAVKGQWKKVVESLEEATPMEQG